MLSLIQPVLEFFFVFSILVILRLIINFFRSFFSTPPKPLEIETRETILNGIFLAYIITYLIYL